MVLICGHSEVGWATNSDLEIVTGTAVLATGATGSMNLKKIGKQVYITYFIDDSAVPSVYNWKTVATIPEGFRPPYDITCQSGYDGSPATVKLILRANGGVSVWCSEATGGVSEGIASYLID